MTENGVPLPPGWYEDGVGNRRWWDGSRWTEWVDRTLPAVFDTRTTLPAAHPAEYEPFRPTPRHEPLADSKRGLSRLAKALLVGVPALLVVATAVVVVIAFVTAEKWIVIDVPEHPETFHTERYSTGSYDVKNNGISPCYVDQDWYECRNSMVAEFNRECAERDLTRAGREICDVYGAELDRMEQIGQYGSVVETVGNLGYLSSTEETRVRRVSNGDYRPAVTHEATCYLGFLGECP